MLDNGVTLQGMPVLFMPVIVSSLLSCNGADKVQPVDEEFIDDTTDEIGINTFG